MEVKQRYSDERININTLEKALDALDSVGCSCNGACLMNTGLSGGAYSVLVYDALVYHPNFEQFIERPETPRKLQNFLYRLFDPFLYKDDKRVRSIISVHQFTPEEFKEWEHEDTSAMKLFQLTMLLYLRSELTNEAKRTLKGQSDSTRSIEGTEFCLD